MKRILVTITNLIIPPFNDNVGDILILNRKLKEYQIDIFRELNLEYKYINKENLFDEDLNNTLIIDDNLFFSKKILVEFIKKADESPHSFTKAVLKKGLFTSQLAILQDTIENEFIVEMPLYYSKNKISSMENHKNIILDVDEFSESGNFPKHMIGKENFKFGITSRPLLVLKEAIHIPLANMAANFARIADLKEMTPREKIKTLFKAGSINKFKLLSAVSIIEKGAEVHPTAVIEGSIIKKGAKIGAYSVVKFSVIGENAVIDDHAGIKFSIIGNGAYIANNNVIFFTTVYPGAFLISGPYHFSCFGYDSAIMNSIPSDYRLDAKTIKIKTSKGMKDTGLVFAGSIIGHRTRIAAGIIIAPGRSIPNDLTIYPDSARVITKINDDDVVAGGKYFLKNGKLESIDG